MSAGLVTGASLIGASRWRKPRAAELPPLQPPDAIVRVAPPAPLPAIGWVEADDRGGTRKVTLGGLAGTPVVLNFWASWCDPCVREMPSLGRLAVALGRDRIRVVALAFDHVDAPVVRGFYQAHGIAGLAVALDPDGAARRVLGIEAIPVTLLIDRQGRLAGRVEGALDWDQALPKVRSLLE